MLSVKLQVHGAWVLDENFLQFNQIPIYITDCTIINYKRLYGRFKRLCTSDKPPHCAAAVPFPALKRVEMVFRFPEGFILRRLPYEQFFSSFFIPAVHCAVADGRRS